MNPRSSNVPSSSTWQVGLALGLVYVCWSTTYFAIQEGVRTLPPFLFGGTRVALAGVCVLAWLWLRGRLVATSSLAVFGMWVAGSLMFVGGNGLINLGQKTVPSGLASVLVATCPLFLALLEWLTPGGDRLPLLAWFGLLAGLVGVVILALGRGLGADAPVPGMLFCLASAFTWALGSVVARHWPSGCSLIQTAGVHLLLGGLTMTVLGIVIGETTELRPESFTTEAVLAFFWLLIVGSLVGFVAYVWLLGHVSAALAGSYAYVNPVLAILIGWALGGETITSGMVMGLVVILAGVALVRAAPGVPPSVEAKLVPADAVPSRNAVEPTAPIRART